MAFFMACYPKGDSTLYEIVIIHIKAHLVFLAEISGRVILSEILPLPGGFWEEDSNYSLW